MCPGSDPAHPLFGAPRVLGVLAGADMPVEQLGEWVGSAEVVLAADAGAHLVLAGGHVPFKAIGDLDSLRGRLSDDVLIWDPDQEHSDCDKLLGLGASLGYEGITLVGLEGDRQDHVLGSLASAVRSPLKVRLALRRGLAWVLTGPATREIEAEPGELMSLMPLETCEGVDFGGVQWPVANRRLSPTSYVSL